MLTLFSLLLFSSPGAIGEILRFDFRRRQQHNQDGGGRNGNGIVVDEAEFVGPNRTLGARDHGPRLQVSSADRRPRSASTPASGCNMAARRAMSERAQSGRVVRIVFSSPSSSSRLPSTATSRMRSGGGAQDNLSPQPEVVDDAVAGSGLLSRSRRQSLPVSVEHVLPHVKPYSSLEDDFV